MYLYVLISAFISFVSFCQSEASTKRPYNYNNPAQAYLFTSDDDVNRFLYEFENEESVESKLQNRNRVSSDRDGRRTDHPVFVSRPIKFGTPAHDQHINNLKEVNGYKTRNLYLRSTKDYNPYIYIVNPIEARFPHPFIPVREFKDVLWERIQLQKDILLERNRDRLKYVPRFEQIKKKRQPNNEVSGRRSNEEVKESNRQEKKKRAPKQEKTSFRPPMTTLSPEEQMNKLKKAIEINNEDPIVVVY